MNGGSVLWLLDPMIAEMDSLRNRDAFMSIEYDLNLDDMLFKYGVRVNKNLAQDMYCNPIPLMIGTQGDTPQHDLFRWLYYPIITSGDKQHPISKNLDAVATKFVSTIDTVKSEGVDTISAFTNRDKSLPGRMIVVGDGDIITNDKSSKGENYPTGFYRSTEETFANQQFLLNCLEYLVDQSGLIESRTREVKLRLLDQGKIKAGKTFWQMLNLILPLVLLLLFAVLYNAFRRRRYAIR